MDRNLFLERNYSKNLKQFLLVLILLLHVTIWSFSTVNAETVNNSVDVPQIYSDACILINLNTDKVLYSKNANEKMYPASTTKVLTAILAVENCKMTDMATVSHDAIFNVPKGYKNAALVEGEQLSVRDLLCVLMIPSANDAAFVLAEHIGGSVENFSKMMNEKAKEIGCKNSNFVNPNGIHDENHYSTAYDLALIGKYALKNSTLRLIASTTKYTLPTSNKYDKTDRVFSTTNDLIKQNSKYYYEYATGLKTGFTEPAQSCIIATAKKDDIELLAVILHASKAEDGTLYREIDCKNLFEYAFNNYSLKKVANEGDIPTTINVKNATLGTRKLELKLNDDVYAYIPNSISSPNITSNVILNDDLEAPIAENTVVGKINYIADGTVYSADLLATHDVKKINWILIVLIAVAILVLILFIRIATKKKNKKKETYSYQSSPNKSQHRSSRNRSSHTEYYQQHSRR